MNTIELITYLVTPIAQVALVMAIAEVAKNLGLESRYIPILDVVVGLTFGILFFTIYQDMELLEGVIIGIAVGLSACGLFSGIKNVLQKG